MFRIKVGKLEIYDFAGIAHITPFGINLSGEKRVDDGEKRDDG